MRANLLAILALSTRHEGGYSNLKGDPGGPTNHGITIGTLSDYMGRRATIPEVKALSLQTANKIYADKYWRPVGGDELFGGLDHTMFDGGINMGTSRVVKILQGVLGIPQDGIFGKQTLAAVAAFADRSDLIRKVNAARLAFCRKLKNWKQFGRGWTYRITGRDPLGKMKPQLGVIGESLRMLTPTKAGIADLGMLINNTVPTLITGKASDALIKVTAPLQNKLQIGGAAAVIVAQAAKLQDFASSYQDTIAIAGYVAAAAGVAAIIAGVVVAVKHFREGGQTTEDIDYDNADNDNAEDDVWNARAAA